MLLAAKCADHALTTNETILWAVALIAFAVCFAAWRFTGGKFDF